MSKHTRKLPTSQDAANHLYIVHHGIVYEIPMKIAEKYKIDVDEQDESVPAETVFKGINQQYSKPGALLRGLRYREGLNQIDFAKKIKVTQSDLSKMENGKRTIGKTIAKRIAKRFDIDYRCFL